MKSYMETLLTTAFLVICLVKITNVIGQELGTLSVETASKPVYAEATKYSDELNKGRKKYTSGPGTGTTVTGEPDMMTLAGNPGNAVPIVKASTLGNEIGGERLALNVSQKRISPKTNLSFRLRQTGNYKLEVLDMNGAIVTVLAAGNGKAGESFEYQFKKANYPAGTYIGRLITEHEVTSTRFAVK